MLQQDLEQIGVRVGEVIREHDDGLPRHRVDVFNPEQRGVGVQQSIGQDVMNAPREPIGRIVVPVALRGTELPLELIERVGARLVDRALERRAHFLDRKMILTREERQDRVDERIARSDGHAGTAAGPER